MAAHENVNVALFPISATEECGFRDTGCMVTRTGKALKEEAAPKNTEGSARHANFFDWCSY
jgi:hypothetical protein